MKLLKVIGFGFMVIYSLAVQGQKKQTIIEPGYEDWYEGAVYLRDGKVISGTLRFLTKLDEGHLQIKEGEMTATMPPEKVISFVLKDSVGNTRRVFESKECDYGFPTRSKLIFLELEYLGDSLSLYRRYLRLPDYSKSITTYEPFLFLSVKNGKTYQISSGMKLLSSTSKKEWIIYHTESSILKSLFGPKYPKFKTYVKSNRLNLSNLEDLIKGLKFMNNEEFIYDRKQTPKRLRN